jgi:hypothetical protein
MTEWAQIECFGIYVHHFWFGKIVYTAKLVYTQIILSEITQVVAQIYV